jgi:hypothetical protein
LSHAKDTANQLKIQAAIGAYKEMEMSVDGDKARRNSVKGILEVFGIDKNKFYYELKKHRASSIGDGAVVTSANERNGGRK